MSEFNPGRRRVIPAAGINPDIGGMRIYEAMRLRLPDFFIHSGDTLYADNPIPAQLVTESGRVWRYITTTQWTVIAADISIGLEAPDGEVNIERQSGELSVVLRDLDGMAVYEQKQQPA